MKSLLPFLLLLVFITDPLASQIKLVEGVRYPDDFKIDARTRASGLAKTALDTLRYKVFRKIKPDFVVNSDGGLYGANQRLINIASDPQGAFLCAWMDDRTGDSQINAQLFDSSGNRKGTVIHVSDSDPTWNSEPHLAFNPKSNEYIVLWAGTGQDIVLQRLTANGDKIGHNATANQFPSSNTNNPSAAIDSSGNIVVTWISDVTCCSSSIPYCRIFSRDGIPVSDQFPLVTPGSTRISSMGWDDRIAADSSGRCLIVWSGYVDGRSRILIQSVNRTGTVHAQPIVVSDPADSIDHIFPTITSTKDGHFLIFWSSARSVIGRIFHPDSGFVSPQFALPYAPYLPYAVSSDDHNQFFIVWPGGKWYGQTLSAQGTLSGPATPVSFPSGGVGYSLRLSKGISNRMYLAYDGYNRQQSDVMVQAFDLSFKPVGASQKAADDGGSAWQYDPTVRYNRAGKSLIVWQDRRNGYRDLYGQVLDETGSPASFPVQISDSTVKYNWGTSIACDNDGNFIVAFSGGDNSSTYLQMQKVSNAGTLSGPKSIVSAPTYAEYWELANVIQTNAAGDVLVSWYSHDNPAVYARRFTPALSAYRSPLLVFNDNAAASPKRIFGLSANDQFNILVMWIDIDKQKYDYGKVMKAMIVNAEGKIVRDTMVVASISDEREFSAGDCRIDAENNLVFVWSDIDPDRYDTKLTVKRIYAEQDRSRSDIIPIDGFYPRIQIIRFENKQAFVAWDPQSGVRSIIFDDKGSWYMPVDLQTPSLPYVRSSDILVIDHTFHADVHGDDLLMSYGGIRTPERGLDIFASVQRIDRSGVLPFEQLVENTASVYPNPSLESAVFQYQVFQPINVRIAVYNILGQKVAELENGIKPPGSYTVKFPTRNIAAGVYFFMYSGARSYSKKFIVVR